jgi:hypothetical protein
MGTPDDDHRRHDYEQHRAADAYEAAYEAAQDRMDAIVKYLAEYLSELHTEVAGQFPGGGDQADTVIAELLTEAPIWTEADRTAYLRRVEEAKKGPRL